MLSDIQQTPSCQILIDWIWNIQSSVMTHHIQCKIWNTKYEGNLFYKYYIGNYYNISIVPVTLGTCLFSCFTSFVGFWVFCRHFHTLIKFTEANSLNHSYFEGSPFTFLICSYCGISFTARPIILILKLNSKYVLWRYPRNIWFLSVVSFQKVLW